MPPRLAVRIFGLFALLVVMCLAPGCERKRALSQDSPDQTLQTAINLIKTNQASRLSDLIYAESPDMRAFLNKLGELLGNMQKLANAVQRRFPGELDKLKAEGDQQAGTTGSPINRLLGAMQGGGGSGGRSRQGGGFNPDDARAMFNSVLADPYGWIESNAGRITTVKLADDTAAILVDGQPAIPIVGLPMRRENGRWYIALPTNAPGVSEVMPRTRDEWSIFASVLHVLSNSMASLAEDVDKGKVGSLKILVDKLQEKTLFPIGIAFAAYGREIDVRGRVDRRVNAFTTRLDKWSTERSGGDPPGVSAELVKLLKELARPAIDKAVRKNVAQRFDQMSDADFEQTVGAWLRDAGTGIGMEGSLAGADVDERIKAWRASKAKPTPPAPKRP